MVSSYILVFASLLLAGGRLADVFGRRRLFVTGLAIFTLASLGAGLAGSGAVLIAARLVQGLGAALMVPTTLAIIVATFDDRRERTQAIGVWAAIGALALAVGPLIGGLISQHLHWGWIFLINVPVGAITMALALFAVAESRDTSAARRLDLPGLAASVVALFSLTYGLIEGHDKGWTSGTILGAFALAAVAGAAFLFIESRSQPADGAAVHVPLPGLSPAGSAPRWCGRSASSASTSSPRCTCRTWSGSRRPRPGWRSSRWRCVWPRSPPISGPLAARFGAYRIVSFGLVLNAIGLFLFWRLGQHTSFGALMPGFVLFGAGCGPDERAADQRGAGRRAAASGPAWPRRC